MEKRSWVQVPKLRAIKRAICEIFIGKALLNLRDILWGTMSNKNYPRAFGGDETKTLQIASMFILFINFRL